MISTTHRARTRAATLLLALATLVPGTHPATAQARLPLQAQAESIIPDDDRWSAFAWSLDRNRPLFAINADEVRIPASNNKVFTSIWALDVLGPEYRFPTDMLVSGPIAGGVLRGDVVIRGSGDPTFGYPEFTEDTMDPLRTMARQLRARGVRVVEGGVIGDASAFDSVLYGPEWPRDTGNGVAAYAPRVSGLPFQRNLISINVEPTRSGAPARVVLSPAVEGIPIKSTVRTGGGRAWAVRNPDEDTIRVRGAVSGRGPHRYRVGVAEPAMMTAGALRQALLDEGIQVRGPARLGATPPAARLVHRHHSIPLWAMIPKLNQESDNFFAEHLWKAAAHRAAGTGSYALGAPASAMHFIEEAKVPYGHIWQADGSGLSAENRASAHALVQALAYADVRPYSEIFHRSLAVAGDPDGTMRRLFRGTAAADNLHAKTGYINDVRTLSGYVTTRGGERVAFSFLYNGRNTSGARGVQQQLGTLLANYTGR